MSATPQEIEHLQVQIAKGAEETKSYLAQLQEKVTAYDAEYKVSETATSYLQAGLEKAHTSVDELKELGGKVKQNTKETSDAWVAAAQASIANVQASLDHLKHRATEYDQRVKSTVSTSVVSTKDTISTSLESIVLSTRQRATTGIDQIAQTIASVQSAIAERAASAGHEAFIKTGDAVKKAEEVDAKYGVRGTIAETVAVVTEKVLDLDKKLGVSETAINLDNKVSGGIGASLVHKGVELVHQSVEYVSNTLHSAKLAAEQSEASAAATATSTAPVAAVDGDVAPAPVAEKTL